MISITLWEAAAVAAHDSWNPGQATQLALHMRSRDLEAIEDGLASLFHKAEEPGGRPVHFPTPLAIHNPSHVWHLCKRHVATWAWTLPQVLDVCDQGPSGRPVSAMAWCR